MSQPRDLTNEEFVTAVITLIEAQAQAREDIVTLAVEAVLRLLRQVASWWDTAETTALALGAAQIVEAAQQQAAASTDAYLAAVSTEIAGRRVRPVGVIPVRRLRPDGRLRSRGLRPGVTTPEVYGRLADQVRYRMAGLHEPEATAARRLEPRAAAMVDEDVAMAMRDQAHKFMVVRRVDGFRRVVHPELSSSGVCGLCLVASDHLYGRGDLLPLHARCKCTVLPIINGVDVGDELNQDAMRQVETSANLGELLRGLSGKERAKKRLTALSHVRYTVEQHRELGPQLRVAGQNFAGHRAA